MQLNNNFENNKNKIGSILPKEINKTTVICKDLIVKEQVEKLISIMNYKLKPDLELLNQEIITEKHRDWTNKDYQDFRRQLGNMTIPSFQSIFPLLIYYLQFSKDELEKELRQIDSLLDLQLFIDERVLDKYTENIILDDGTKLKLKKEKYVYIKHIFNTGDLPNLFKALHSKLTSYHNILLSSYESKSDKTKTLDEQIEDLKLLIETVNESKELFIPLIEEKYFTWIDKISKNNILYQYLNELLSNVIEGNKNSLRIKLADLKQRKSDIHKIYISRRQNEAMDLKAKNKVRKEGYKFG